MESIEYLNLKRPSLKSLMSLKLFTFALFFNVVFSSSTNVERESRDTLFDKMRF